MSDHRDRLDIIRDDAERYAAMESKPSSEKTTEEREWRSGVLASIPSMSAGEVVYFCQNVISNMQSHASASMTLTVLYNRLLDRENHASL